LIVFYPHGIEDNIYPKFGIILGQEPFVPEIIIPFAAIVFIAEEYADAVIYQNCFQVIMYQVISPAIQFKRGSGRAFFKAEK